MRLPPPLRPGDGIAVVAPSSPFEHAPAWVGLGWLAVRYKVRFVRGLFARKGYLAGDDERRLQELSAALNDPEVRAVLAARGGYGLSRIAHRVDWAAFAERPTWIVGFSDITALHVEAARVGVASLHASHLTALGRGDERLRRAWMDTLEEPQRARRFEGLPVLRSGRAQGPLFGGNLAILHACAAAGRLVVPEGAVMLLEDVTERPYRLDRMLSNLEVAGHLARASAFVLGDFHQCDAGADGVTAAEVLAERLERLGVPVCAGLPVGHGRDNAPVVLGASTVVDATGELATVMVGAAG